MKLIVLFSVVAMSLGAPCASVSAPAPFSIPEVISLRALSDCAWSADGQRFAFVVADPDTTASTTNYDIYAVDWRHSAMPRRLTPNPLGDGSPTFSPTGDTLAYTSVHAGTPFSSIWMLRLRGGEPWAFGHYDEGVGEVKWSPDGRWLAYTKNEPLPKRVSDLRRAKRDPVVENERWQYPQVWITDIASGTQRLLIGGTRYVWNLRWSPDSKHIAFLVSPTGAVDDGNLVDIGVVPIGGGAIHTLDCVGADFTWSPDSRWIAWASGGHRDVFVEKSDVWVCGAESGAPRCLTTGFDFEPTTPAWTPGSDTLLFHVPQGVTTVLAAVPLAGGEVRVLADRRAAAGPLYMGPAGWLAWTQSQPELPEEFYVSHGAGAAAINASMLNARAGVAPVAKTGTFRWTSSDGVKVEGLLIRPRGAPDHAPLRTLVFLHGGPYSFRADLGFQAYAQVFASAGYQVFMPNYRSSGGYGAAFLVRERADWGGQDWRDISTGVDSLVAAGLADADRLGVFGGSYGGYLTAWAITQTDRFKVAFMERGIVDLPAIWGQSDTHQYRAWDFGGRPWERFDRWWERSPIAHIARAKTPTLIIVGDNDARTPIAQSRELYESLRSLGIPVEFVHYPREGHGLREPRHRADAMQRALAWFDRWIP